MSDRQRAKAIIDELPENKLIYVLTYLQGLTDGIEDEPNDETLEALEETDNAIKSGNVVSFNGSTDDFFNDILEG